MPSARERGLGSEGLIPDPHLLALPELRVPWKTSPASRRMMLPPAALICSLKVYRRATPSLQGLLEGLEGFQVGAGIF